MKSTLRKQDLALLVGARHWDPFSVLGPHVVEEGGKRYVSVRVIQPRGRDVQVVRDNDYRFISDRALGATTAYGVTSISVDLHKYAYTPKGVSVLLHATPALRRGHCPRLGGAGGGARAVFVLPSSSRGVSRMRERSVHPRRDG